MEAYAGDNPGGTAPMGVNPGGTNPGGSNPMGSWSPGKEVKLKRRTDVSACVDLELPSTAHYKTCELQKEKGFCEKEHNQFPGGYCVKTCGFCTSEEKLVASPEAQAVASPAASPSPISCMHFAEHSHPLMSSRRSVLDSFNNEPSTAPSASLSLQPA